MAEKIETVANPTALDLSLAHVRCAATRVGNGGYWQRMLERSGAALELVTGQVAADIAATVFEAEELKHWEMSRPEATYPALVDGAPWYTSPHFWETRMALVGVMMPPFREGEDGKPQVYRFGIDHIRHGVATVAADTRRFVTDVIECPDTLACDEIIQIAALGSRWFK